MSAADFEVLGFRGDPAGADAAVLELHGRFGTAGRRRVAPRLWVELPDDDGAEHAPVTSEDLPGRGWRATFAVPVEALQSATFALALDDVLLDLPAPDLGEDTARHVRLAREANQLRRRLDEALDGLAEAEARAERAEGVLEREREIREAAETAHGLAEAERAETQAALDAERERATHADDAARSDLDAERRRLTDEAATERHRFEEELARARAEAEAARHDAEVRLSEARAEADRLVATEREVGERRLDEALAAERARAGLARRELLAARAELEALRREGPRRAEPTIRRARPAPEPHPEAPSDQAETARPPEIPGDEGGEAPTQAVAARTALWSGGATDNGDAPTAVAASEPLTADEGVRVLSPRPRPRHRLEDETGDVALSPGATAIGARNMEPAGGPDARTARALAIGALSGGGLLALLAILGVWPF